MPPQDIGVPVCSWRPGQSLPHAGRVSWTSRKRYAKGRLRNMQAYFATERTRRRFGQFTTPSIKALQSSHDLAVAELFVALTRRWPRLATHWQGEDMYCHERQFAEKVEDAVIVRNHKPILAIEVGAYRGDRFQEKFRDFAARQLAFRCY
jgi:hypothetical protein